MTGLPAIQRPDGRLYRPRKVVAYLVGEEDETVIVLGTHDSARAQVLADALVYSDIDSGCAAADPVAGWWRDGFENGQPRWIPDEMRGRAGVYFRGVVETGGPQRYP